MNSLHLYHDQVWSTSPPTTTSTATLLPGTPWSGTTSLSRSQTSGCRGISTALTTTASRASHCCQSGAIFHAQYNCKINSKYFYFCFKYLSLKYFHSCFNIFLFVLLRYFYFSVENIFRRAVVQQNLLNCGCLGGCHRRASFT